ncbi:TPA: hypothetical protein OTP15_002618 [Salmonella enterica subsp. enterica serovar Kisangani]|nr:hypothetical protein [Salmonella enterica subsp. enterica]ECC2067613.1 hypothetical protein [Salmonella enterica]EKY4934545.1 hypothetical protein [Salmonella enterica]HCT3076697.1 hypothetical protein [Salmonella enterica subsp. enterica serovar Kisangani]HCT3087492.1 hypothetical protein [Salmonella enterica subsp. enterica serovar Kisangani]
MGSNIIELAKLGHERAAELKASCGAVDVRSLAQLISDLATQLEVQFVRSTNMAVQLANSESKCRELAAESSGMKQLASEAYDEMVSHHDTDSLYSLDADGEQMDALIRLCDAQATIYDTLVMCETPATDAFLAEARAQGVTEYASKRGFSFQHGSIHAHFGNGDVMVGSVTFENGDAGINFAPVREKTGGVGTSYEWTNGKTTEQIDSVFTIASSNAEGLEVIRDKLSEAIAQLRKGAAL